MYKIGDLVQVKGKEWYDTYKNAEGEIVFNSGFLFRPQMAEYCGRRSEVVSVSQEGTYVLDGIDRWYFSDEALEPIFPQHNGIEQEQEASPWDVQVAGDHYKTVAIQPFLYSMANHLDPLQHTAIKYITRHETKGQKADLEKAIHCIQLLIDYKYGESPTIAGVPRGLIP